MHKQFITNKIIITILLSTVFFTGCTSPQEDSLISKVTSEEETLIPEVTYEKNTPGIEESIIAEPEIPQIPDTAEMQFIKENTITLEKSLNKNILFSTQTAKLSGEPENIKGLICFEGIEAFDSSERFEEKEGYEWRKINCSGIFNPQEYEAIRDKGVDFGWGFADAQTGTGFIESKKDIEIVENNGQNFQTQTWNIGERTFDITIASVFQSGWVEQRKESNRPIDGLIPVALYKMLAPFDWFNNMTPEEQKQEILYCKARQFYRIPQPWETEAEWRERMEQEDISWYSSDYILDYEKIYQDIEQEEIEWYGTSDYTKWGN